MRRNAGSGIVANPVLVGAVTVLITLVAVFLAYNANNGLPFVPTKLYRVQVENGSNLVPGNEVRSGGYRVGVVNDMKPVRLPGGQTGAELELKLDNKLGDLPKDSAIRIRARSALGLRYVELAKGRSQDVYQDGDLIPVVETSASQDIDRVLSTFDEDTRNAARHNLQGFGDTFAGRGRSLGLTIEELPGLFGHLEPVMRVLADDDTGLENFFGELSDAARIVRPVSELNAALFTDMADTFEAIGRDEAALKDFISKGPPTLDVATDSLRVQRPFLSEFADFSGDLRGVADELDAALPTINRAVDRGIGVQRRAVTLNRSLGETLQAVRELVEAPSTLNALRGLTATVATANPQLRFYGPYVTVCNYWNDFWTKVAEHFSEPDSTGHVQRALVNTTGRQDDSLGSQDANGPASGKNVTEGTPQFLHGPPFGRAVADDGTADCEIGQRGFLKRNARFAPKTDAFLIARDPRNPGLQGPTYTGRARVPAGQTFAPLPETGPYKDIPESEFGGR